MLRVLEACLRPNLLVTVHWLVLTRSVTCSIDSGSTHQPLFLACIVSLHTARSTRGSSHSLMLLRIAFLTHTDDFFTASALDNVVDTCGRNIPEYRAKPVNEKPLTISSMRCLSGEPQVSTISFSICSYFALMTERTSGCIMNTSLSSKICVSLARDIQILRASILA